MRNIISARVGLKDAMTNYLRSSKDTNSWPDWQKRHTYNFLSRIGICSTHWVLGFIWWRRIGALPANM